MVFVRFEDGSRNKMDYGPYQRVQIHNCVLMASNDGDTFFMLASEAAGGVWVIEVGEKAGRRFADVIIGKWT